MCMLEQIKAKQSPEVPWTKGEELLVQGEDLQLLPSYSLPCQPPAFNYVVENSHNSAIQGGI